MDRDPTVDRYMTADPCAIDEGLTLADAADRMQANHIHHLLVLRDTALLGVVTATDLSIALAVSGSEGATPVRSAVRPALVCPPHTRLVDVAARLEHDHEECAVIVDGDSQAVGIFTRTDALRALREQLLGHEVAPEATSTHMLVESGERRAVLPSVRVRRLLGGASPSPNDGKLF